MTEFEVAGQGYRSGKMNARTQFHVMRRMAPIIGPLQAFAAGQTQDALTALAGAIGELPDEAADYIVDACLAVVERKQERGGYAKVKPAGVKDTMFSDIDMLALLQIVSHVLQDNYAPVFQKGLALSRSGEAVQA